MRMLIIGLMIVLASCQTKTHQKDTISVNSGCTNEDDSSLNVHCEYPMEVIYTSDIKADTMFIYLGADRLLITPRGEVFKNGELFFNIQPEGVIQKLFPILIGEDMVVVYVSSPNDGEAGSYAKRISLKQKKTIWETTIFGFNLARPVLVGENAYLSTIGFVGKLNLSTGKFVWRFEDLFQNGKYARFNEPIFYKDSSVFFIEYNYPKPSGILVDDKNGLILKKD